MVGFRSAGGAVVAELEPGEIQLLRNLLEEMRTLLDADIPRSDPVIGRLFPDAYEDAEDSQAYRELVGDELRDVKLQTLATARATLDRAGGAPLTLGPEEVETWLSLLTDLRLAIGTRLDVTEPEMEMELDPDDARAPAFAVLHWLGWMQGALLEAWIDGPVEEA